MGFFKGMLCGFAVVFATTIALYQNSLDNYKHLSSKISNIKFLLSSSSPIQEQTLTRDSSETQSANTRIVLEVKKTIDSYKQQWNNYIIDLAERINKYL